MASESEKRAIKNYRAKCTDLKFSFNMENENDVKTLERFIAFSKKFKSKKEAFSYLINSVAFTALDDKSSSYNQN